MGSIKRVAKNTAFVFVSQIINYVLAFFATLYTARYLGPDAYGILSLGLAFTAMFGILCDLGLGTLTTREVSRNKSVANKYLFNTTLMRVILSFLLIILTILAVNIIGYPPEVRIVIYILTFALIFNSLGNAFSAVFQAYEKMEYSSIIGIIGTVLIFVGFLISIYYGLSVVAFALVYLIGGVVCLIVNLIFFFRALFFPKIELDWDLWKPAIMQALPLSFAAIFSTIAFKVDTIILSIIKGTLEVGWYSASYNLMQALMFIPSAVITAIFPILATLFISSHDSLKKTYQKTFKYLSILGIPIAFGTTLLADKIILLIYEQSFIPSIVTLQILIWTIPLIFVTMLLGTMFASINKQNLVVKILAVIMVFNIALNLILIPIYSYIGAAVVTVLTEAIGFVLQYYYISKFVSKVNIKDTIIKPIIASMIMSLFIYYFISMNLFVLIIAGSVIYFVIIILLKTFTDDDYDLFKQVVRIKR